MAVPRARPQRSSFLIRLLAFTKSRGKTGQVANSPKPQGKDSFAHGGDITPLPEQD